MSLLRFYVQHQKLILPTVAETEDGFFIDIGPVKVVPIEDKHIWSPLLISRMAAGNEIVPTPDRSDDPGSAILEALRIDKWSTFETSATMYTIHRGGGYINVYRTGRGSDGMWSNQTMQHRRFDPRAPLAILFSIVVEDISKQPEANRPKTGLMMLPKSPPAQIAENKQD